MRLKDKTAIVTGAASGFGAGIAAKFIAEGARVLVADLNGDGAAEVAQSLGPNATACQADVGSSASVNAMAETALSAFGTLDIIINNAGVTHLPKPMEEVSEEDFDRVTNVNMKSIYFIAKALVPHSRFFRCFDKISQYSASLARA